MQQVIDDLNWRYATKRFDTDKKLSDAQLSALKESIRLSASSYGLQPFTVLVVETAALREKLMVAAYGQQPIVDASHLFVFCAYTKVDEGDVHKYMDLIAKTRKVEPESLAPFANGVIGTLKNLSDEDIRNWTSKQTYIALGQLMHTCASLKIDSLPMEGFDPKAFNKILELDKLNLTATLACPVGFRHEEDAAQFKKKVRKSNEDMFDLR